MAGGGGEGARDLDQTPTWAVAVVCAVIILISIFLKRFSIACQWFTDKHKKALYEALEKVKSGVILTHLTVDDFGFISLLLTFGQSYITKICITKRVADKMLPCSLEEDDSGESRRRLLWVSAENSSYACRSLCRCFNQLMHKWKAPFVLHKWAAPVAHIHILFLAIFMSFIVLLTMALGKLKICRWKEWKRRPNPLPIPFSNGLLFPPVLRSVRKADFDSAPWFHQWVHLAPGSKFNFQKYIKRSLEDDFKIVVGIRNRFAVLGVIDTLVVSHIQTIKDGIAYEEVHLDEQTTFALKKWHQVVRKRHKEEHPVPHRKPRHESDDKPKLIPCSSPPSQGARRSGIPTSCKIGVFRTTNARVLKRCGPFGTSRTARTRARRTTARDGDEIPSFQAQDGGHRGGGARAH
ncbi:hypothetical protein HPP92_022541 [Vanilla planifolia]|uniref:MLO-like protein n=1 Tax=Vanilla planifolia TaxID=51239 RepID=A0A835PPV3_VANPL|nr:hypothetical protein HPP92_022541 [Vanilla planifolia]